MNKSLILFLLLVNTFFSAKTQNFAFMATSSEALPSGVGFELYKIDLNTCEKEKLATIKENIGGDIAYNPKENKLYFRGLGYYITSLDLSTFETKPEAQFRYTITEPNSYAYPFVAFDFDSSGNLYASFNSIIFKVDLKNKRLDTLKQFDEPDNIEGMAFKNGSLFVKTIRNKIYEVDTTTWEKKLLTNKPMPFIWYSFENSLISNCQDEFYSHNWRTIYRHKFNEDHTYLTTEKACEVDYWIYGLAGLNEFNTNPKVTETEISVNGDSKNSVFNFCINQSINLAGNTPNIANFEQNEWKTISKGESVRISSNNPSINDIIPKKAGQDTIIYQFTSRIDGCRNTDTAFLNIVDYPNKTLLGDDFICDNQSTQIKLMEQDSSYKVNWYYNSLTIENQDFELLSIKEEGKYWALIDNGVCPITSTDTFDLKVHQLTVPILKSNNFNDAFCVDASIKLIGNPIKSIEGELTNWTALGANPIASILNPEQQESEIIIQESGKQWFEYSIRLDAQNCIKKEAIQLSFVDYPKIKLFGDTLICETNQAKMSFESNQKKLIFEWLINDISLIESQDSLAYFSKSGDYKVKASNSICPPVYSNTISLKVDTLPKAAILLNGDLTPRLEIYEGKVVEISSTDLLAQNEWLISSSDDFFSPNTLKGNWYSENKIGENSIYLNSENGTCSTQDSAIIYVKAKIIAPNVFTRNGDGINDSFKIRGLETYSDVLVSIYNRWGNLIYETNDYPNNEWKGGNVQAGVYFYVIQTELGKHNGIIHLLE